MSDFADARFLELQGDNVLIRSNSPSLTLSFYWEIILNILSVLFIIIIIIIIIIININIIIINIIIINIIWDYLLFLSFRYKTVETALYLIIGICPSLPLVFATVSFYSVLLPLISFVQSVNSLIA